MSGTGTLTRRGDYWYMDWTDEKGERHRSSTRTTDKSAALQHMREAMAAGPVTADFVQGAMEELQLDLKAREVKSYLKTVSHMKPVIEFFQGTRCKDIEEADIQRYTRWRREAGKAAGTINRELKLLKQALVLQHRRGKLRKVPRILNLPDHAVRTGFFTQEEVNRVIAFLPKHLKDMTLVAFLTGWRLGELRHLQWRDLDMIRHVVTLKGERTKNGEMRSMRLPDVIWALLMRQPKEGPYVFNLHGAQIGDFNRTWKRAVARAEMPERHFHDLRRSAVRNMLRAGAPEWAARKVTGHKTRYMLDRYNITSEEEAYDALKKVSV